MWFGHELVARQTARRRGRIEAPVQALVAGERRRQRETNPRHSAQAIEDVACIIARQRAFDARTQVAQLSALHDVMHRARPNGV